MQFQLCPKRLDDYLESKTENLNYYFSIGWYPNNQIKISQYYEHSSTFAMSNDYQ